MSNKKRVVLGVMMGVVLMLSIIVVSAAIHELFKGGDDSDLEGELLEPADVSISMANSDPVIESWTLGKKDGVNSGWSVSNACQSLSIVTGTPVGAIGVDVVVSDPNGDGDLSGTTADITLTQGLETIFGDDACVVIASTIDGDNEATLRCTFTLNFYNLAGYWDITINDFDDNLGSAFVSQSSVADEDLTYPKFLVNPFAAIEIKDSGDVSYSVGDKTLDFINVEISSVNKEADNNLVVQNCGNEAVDSVTSFIQVRGDNLRGADDISLMLPSTFKFDDVTPACTSGIGLTTSDVNVAGLILNVGASSTDKDIYFCIAGVLPTTLPTQAYSTTAPGGSSNPNTPWQVNICTTSC